ncbi:7TM diverse intracellular signaling domain-containing protein [Flavobacterium sp. GT2N3]|uniref:hybrid sensor histidine kinase/response regulator n=1 Tax=unclassified Flavobacterium TaxID=196869 RepID=UPI003AACBC39
MNFKNYKIQLSTFSLLLIFLFLSISSEAQYIVANRAQFKDGVSLHKYAKIVNVGQRNYTIQEIINDKSLKFEPLLVENKDLGFTDDNYWLVFEIVNNTTTEIRPFIETSRAIVDVAELYVIDLSGKIEFLKSGDVMPFQERSLNSTKTLFRPVLQPKQVTRFYLHLKSDGEVINAPIYLKSAEKELEIASFEQFIFGIFYGLLFITAIIYMFFYFAMKEKSFLFYSLYVTFIGLLQFSVDGYFYQYFAPNNGWLSSHSVIIFATVANFFLGKYSEVYLNIKKYSLTIYTMFCVLYVLNFLSILTLLIYPKSIQYLYPTANILGLFLLVLILVSIAVVYYKTKKIEKFFSIGIFFLISGFVIFILKNFSVLPSVFWTENSSKLGIGVEVIFLSLSMANLIRNLKYEKNELNRLALVRSEEMNDLKSYFLSNISHELRTPLNAIMNMIDSISVEVQDDEIRKNCQIIKYSSHSLLSSVNDILDFSKIEKKEIKLESIPFNPWGVLENLKNNAANRAIDQGLDFQFSKSESIPDFLIGDVTRLVQVVNNVLNNAIKFTTNGFIKFDIECKIKENNRACLQFTVADSGVGIAEEKMNSIFDSFSQNSIDNKRKFGGLGLGLYIVKTLVDMQHGTVEMESKVNVGTTCRITLDFDIVPQGEKTEVLTTPTVYDLKGKSVLVVEDNPINQMVVKMITKKWMNTTVVYANNGVECLEAFKTNHFDIVLMDLQMPLMDGYEATIAIRNGGAGAAYASIPIIAVTADVMESTKLRVAEIGMNDYLSKPIKKDTLYHSVKKLL